MNDSQLYTSVQDHYGSAARGHDDNEYGRIVAQQFGYSEEELRSIPKDANLGLSCGNPHALARLKEGEAVIDLGSGAGFDVFLAANNVGPSGRAIGVDMNTDMLRRANKLKQDRSASNVSFIESEITDIDLPNAVADCIISNCVINLVPEAHKPKVFTEIFRLLKPGGRVAVSDILAKGPLPEHIRSDVALYVGCIAGASQVSQYEGYLQQAGFEDILIVDTESDLNVYRTAGNTDCCGSRCAPAEKKCGSQAPENSSNAFEGLSNGSKDLDFNAYAGSFKIFAVKK